ncbi:type IV pilus modification protein PilV [Parazoarcus communis]|uniref:Type IV pilus modification protein PilV n=1 Tax=Parazoarcus communis SWub3 = DSM 12120 TaxID=1121029 RepID=A0A323UX46_9RHOO|nr:type IV pilus modification protein PilV [Parazoarcus communis]NMG70545.1 type IV pilus modification protein PilV [Parazoarcus communis SWub3 = DSM 12120]PZA15796.1 type IV pilus modification protein PilV [Azoarcus communis] [Parazoarcus communis SWub3 = DSM 12120]
MKQHRQAGSSLLEILIAVLVLSFGLLGVAGMQMSALRNNQSAAERSQVVFMTYSILDAMRANIDTSTTPHSFRPEDYTDAAVLGNWVCADDPPEGNSLAAKDAARWINNLGANLGESACGKVACNLNTCTVSIRWDDSRGTSGSGTQVIETRSQL